MESKAELFLFSSVSASNLIKYEGKETAFEQFEVIRLSHTAHARNNVGDIYSALLNIKLDNSTDALVYTQTIREITSKIEYHNASVPLNQREPISDSLVSQIIIKSVSGEKWMNLMFNDIIRKGEKPEVQTLLDSIDRLANNLVKVEANQVKEEQSFLARIGERKGGNGNGNGNNGGNGRVDNRSRGSITRCTSILHNKEAAHTEDMCFFLHPEKRPGYVLRHVVGVASVAVDPQDELARLQLRFNALEKAHATHDLIDRIGPTERAFVTIAASSYFANHTGANTIALDSGATISMARNSNSFIDLKP